MVELAQFPAADLAAQRARAAGDVGIAVSDYMAGKTSG
jgi:hypothetical protein